MAFNLLANALAGAAYLILLFGLCFGSVVGIKLLNRKLRENERKPSDEAKEEEPAPVPEKKAPAPRTAAKKRTASARPKTQKIYYIVEKKSTRSKAEYAEPKEIKFEK